MEVFTSDEIRYFKQLDERQQRLFVGLRAKALGRGGVKLVSDSLGIHENTVQRGQSELSELPDTLEKRVRKTGGGAKKVMSRPELLDVFDKVLADNTAGLPENVSVK